MHKGSLFSTSPPALLFSFLFDNSHFDRCEVISHCGFDLHFDLIGYVTHLSCACWPYVTLGKMSIQIPCSFFNQLLFLLACMSCLYILNINPLWVISFINISSHSVRCLFVLLVVSFTVQKLFSLIWVHLFIFALLPLPEETDPKKK